MPSAMTQLQNSILLIDDEPQIRKFLRISLNAQGYRVLEAGTGEEGLAQAALNRPDLVVLDLMLPGEDGLSICRQVRPQFDGPILMLTARTDDMDEVLGLEMGADDYVCKPVRPRVLLARIRALLRRSEAPEAGAPAADSKRLAFGRLVIDNAMREAWLDGTTIELTSAEFDLLWLLAANAGRILSREEIFNALRGIEYDGQDRSIDVRISRIRPKIGDDPMHPRLIKTVRSKGYLFVGEG
ncbi:hypothetical protein ALP65_01748 [Pseudomonas aeruginosa]|uniref:Two-component response regulator n=11 Tax=Pseudomonas aeruginosa TaxID=287 RepID=A0A3M5D3P0_PSEAI|nr:hypothetical protein ALP65_01748 [Pseudomonas aeruginosa]